MYKSILASVGFVLVLSQSAAAQQAALRLSSVTIDTKKITGSCVTGQQVDTAVTHGTYHLDLPAATCTDSKFELDVSSLDLQDGDTVTIKQVSGGTATSTSGTVSGDSREDFDASGHIGFAIDTFAAEEDPEISEPDRERQTSRTRRVRF